jgi:hypothetical protein
MLKSLLVGVVPLERAVMLVIFHRGAVACGSTRRSKYLHEPRMNSDSRTSELLRTRASRTLNPPTQIPIHVGRHGIRLRAPQPHQAGREPRSLMLRWRWGRKKRSIGFELYGFEWDSRRRRCHQRVRDCGRRPLATVHSTAQPDRYIRSLYTVALVATLRG